METVRLNALIELLAPLDPDEKRILTGLIQKITRFAGRREDAESEATIHETDDRDH
ncbi:MAG TPA: hypothetical protein GX509_09435 [Firmicutes bacterium]|nr:hypothetical protein [Bacillota bacterium]HHY98946.1 hypothetical protein [Bacillota bacterium]